DHHRVLHRRRWHLHAPRAANRGMRNIAVATDLIRRIDDHDALAQIIGKYARRFAQQSGLANARPPHHEDAAAGFDDVADDGDGAEDGATDATRDADDPPFAIPNCRDTVQRALDASPVVVAKGADSLDDIVDVFFGYRVSREKDLATRHPRLGLPPE